MKYRKFNKYERKEIRSEQVAKALHGEGLYLFANSHNADLTLPRPTKSGRRTVGPKEQFQGDNYYMQMVRSGDLRLIKTLQSPEEQQQLQENTMENEKKLILDQPDMVTESGKVEHIAATPVSRPLNEGDNDKQPDVLINEDPAGFIILD